VGKTSLYITVVAESQLVANYYPNKKQKGMLKEGLSTVEKTASIIPCATNKK